MEIIETTININAKKITCITVYRPESLDINKYIISTSFTEFENLFTHYSNLKDDFLIIDDFNFHINKPDKKTIKRMIEIVEVFDLIPNVTDPTHKFVNTLDLIIIKKYTELLSHKVDEMLSDHNAQLMDINIQNLP